jgi:hypothetical protein
MDIIREEPVYPKGSPTRKENEKIELGKEYHQLFLQPFFNQQE